jgi:hypothetical protein
MSVIDSGDAFDIEFQRFVVAQTFWQRLNSVIFGREPRVHHVGLGHKLEDMAA